jgi:hypothetical protein
MDYQICGKSCLPTCSDPEGEQCADMGNCQEGCFCKDGLVYDGESKCIRPNQCGCAVPEQNVFVNVRVIALIFISFMITT